MDQPYLFLGIKINPGPIERHKLENFALDNTVDTLKSEAEKKSNVPSASLELIHHGKILKDGQSLQESGVKSGETVHVVKKKVQPPPAPPPTFSDSDLQLLNSSLRTLGCTPNAPGWTRAMQLLNDESAMAEIIEQAPSIGEDCVALSILHEVELLAALGANIHTMRRGANAHPELPAALRHLTRLVRSRNSTTSSTDSVPTSGFAYSLEALSEDEDADEEESEDAERSPITQEQFTAALQAATDAISSSSGRGTGSQGGGSQTGGSQGGDNQGGGTQGGGTQGSGTQGDGTPGSGTPGLRPLTGISSYIPGTHDSLLRLLQGETSRTDATYDPNLPRGMAAIQSLITPQMFSNAISDVMTRARRYPDASSMDLNPATHELARLAANIAERNRLAAVIGEEPLGPASEYEDTRTQEERDRNEEFHRQLEHMNEMGLLDDALNIRALIICAGDVNGAINLVFSGAIGDE